MQALYAWICRRRMSGLRRLPMTSHGRTRISVSTLLVTLLEAN